MLANKQHQGYAFLPTIHNSLLIGHIRWNLITYLFYRLCMTNPWYDVYLPVLIFVVHLGISTRVNTPRATWTLKSLKSQNPINIWRTGRIFWVNSYILNFCFRNFQAWVPPASLSTSVDLWDIKTNWMYLGGELKYEKMDYEIDWKSTPSGSTFWVGFEGPDSYLPTWRPRPFSL